MRDGTLSRAEFATQVQPIRMEVKRLLEEGASAAMHKLIRLVFGVIHSGLPFAPSKHLP